MFHLPSDRPISQALPALAIAVVSLGFSSSRATDEKGTQINHPVQMEISNLLLEKINQIDMDLERFSIERETNTKRLSQIKDQCSECRVDGMEDPVDQTAELARQEAKSLEVQLAAIEDEISRLERERVVYQRIYKEAPDAISVLTDHHNKQSEIARQSDAEEKKMRADVLAMAKAQAERSPASQQDPGAVQKLAQMEVAFHQTESKTDQLRTEIKVLESAISYLQFYCQSCRASAPGAPNLGEDDL